MKQLDIQLDKQMPKTFKTYQTTRALTTLSNNNRGFWLYCWESGPMNPPHIITSHPNSELMNIFYNYMRLYNETT